MAYVEEFRSRLSARDCNRSLMLWQEYCENDVPDVDELIQILTLIKQSDQAKAFGPYVEAILPLVMTVSDEPLRLEALRLVYDLQTSNSQPLYDLALEILKSKFSTDPLFAEKLRLTGLRTRENFQGALANFFLLNHMIKGNHVYHTAGWGVGEILDFSFVREQVTVRFENLGGCKRDISFKNAFRSLTPLAKDHFLALRLESPESLETMAMKDPVALVAKILNDLGPQSAADLKELLSDYVLPQEDYAKWWQSARAKLKKNGHIESPKTAKGCFVLRKAELSHMDRVTQALQGKESFREIFGTLYAVVRDFPDVVKDPEIRNLVFEHVQRLLSMEEAGTPEQLQVYFFLEQLRELNEHGERIKALVQSISDFGAILEKIEVLSLQKRLLAAIRQHLPNWEEIFADQIPVSGSSQLRDYLLKELLSATADPSLLGAGSATGPRHHSTALRQLEGALHKLLNDPALYPEAFLWYFQKVAADEAPLMCSQADKERFFENFLVLMSTLEMRRDSRDIVKKMQSMLTGDRFKIVRALLKDTDLAYAREFLLLASKCQTLTPHDQTILRALVDVVHGGGTAENRGHSWDQSVIWTTEEGYKKAREQIQHIGTVEMVANAREIEEARAHGDLRENAEYKCALERRARLQNQLKTLSDQFNRARIITTEDVSTNVVSVGTRVHLATAQGEKMMFTILGPWDADVENNILSVHSKLAQNLLGKRTGARFEFRNEPVTIEKIESCL